MNKQTFIQLIKDPSGISPEQLMELEKVVGGFPYCQVAHILIAKQAAETGSMLADQKTKKAAAYTLDRKNLKKLLSNPKEKEFTEVKHIPLQELPFIEKIAVESLDSEKIEVNKNTKEDPSNVLVELKEETNEKSTLPEITTEEKLPPQKEALTDDKRDQIIKELQENLKRLHDSKIKAAWEELPTEIKVIGINDETIEIPKEEIKDPVVEINPEESINKPYSEESVITPLKEVNDNEGKEWVIASENNYPLRTEDVVVEIKETEADNDLMLEYLSFLEEKRGVFRKNKKKEVEIIDKIIKEDPTIPKLDINNLPDNSIDLSSKSITISKGPVSENFAKILSLQGKREKAIEIYEQLILKNPEKKPYFEAQIEKLKNRI